MSCLSYGAFGNRRAALAVRPVLEYMTMPTLLAWRSTCHYNHSSVNDHLRETLHALVGRFIPDPEYFLKLLAPWGCLIVGEAALSHVLHDPELCKASLELAIGNLYFQPFVDCLARLFPVGSQLSSLVVKSVSVDFAFHRHITRIAEFRLASGLVVVLYESSTPSACDVISGYWSTALMNFVTGFMFGCAYPRLTFNRFSLICDARTAAMGWWDHDLAMRLDSLDFHTDTRPDQCALFFPGPSSDLSTMDACGRSVYVCPLQGRFFGDRGSLVLFYDGFNVDLIELRDLGVAPYGPMVTWRIPSHGTCGSRCIEKDSVIPPFIVSILSRFAEDASGFARAHPAVHTIVDPHNRTPVISPPSHRRGRRYSV